MLNTDRTLHSILHEHYDYIEGAFKRKGTKNDIIENWLKIEYTPISWPTIFVPEKAVRIGLNKAIYVYFTEQFLRDNPTAMQRRKFATIMNILRSAYLKGVADGRR